MTASTKRLRCAIYTRKSTEEGLDQRFNSLDAQREACEAYILSQAGEGWECSANAYDDGGWSGGSMDRPALQRLLDDMGKGRIDIVVVYKVDRLTRSLMDFSRIVEKFDAQAVSFVSVTQAFNTTSSMGRLTLNILLSFAQFERDVTGERIRDKIAASKARGMWMGGNIPLGYDLGDRRLLINEAEADQVRHIFGRYLELSSIPLLAKELAAEGIHSKRWTSRNGTSHGGSVLRCGAIAHILNNRIYLGEILHREKSYHGEHPRIVEHALFDAVQSVLANNRLKKTRRKAKAASSPLAGKLFDADDQPVRPQFSYGRGSRMYRYYVSESLLPNGQLAGPDNMRGIRVSAERIERLLVSKLSVLDERQGVSRVFDAITKATITSDWISMTLDMRMWIENGTPPFGLLEIAKTHIDPHAAIDLCYLRIAINAKTLKRGRTIGPQRHLLDAAEQKSTLADLLRTSHRVLGQRSASPLDPVSHGSMSAPIGEWERCRVAAALLAPDIQKSILLGTVPQELHPSLLLSADIPLNWEEQRRMFGFNL